MPKLTKMDLIRTRLLIGTQQQVADELQIHRTTVSGYEQEGAEVPAWYLAALEGLKARKGL